MDKKILINLLEQVKEGRVTVDEACHRLKNLPYEDLGYAKVDHHRGLRKGFPEVIYCPGKTTGQIVGITGRMVSSGTTVLATRAEPSVYQAISGSFPRAEYHELARAVVIRNDVPVDLKGKVIVVSAGTADLPVAEEAFLTAELMGSRAHKLYDVGVAGLHRLLDHRDIMEDANVIVVVAGMEGALASVVGGLVSCPVIAVPTSVGYGANFNGLAPLLTMLNSCATGVAVVNIDNGFGAGYMAALVNRVREGI